MAGEESRNQQLVRVLRLVEDLLAGTEHDRNTVAKLLGVTVATADRQLAALKSTLTGMRVRTEKRIKRYRLLVKKDAGGPLPIGAGIAACLGGAIAPLFDGTSYADGVRKSTKRVIQQVQRESEFADFERKFVFRTQGGEAALPEASGRLDEVLQAVLDTRWIAATYERFSGDTERVRVKPLSIVVYAHQLYVLGEAGDGRRHPYRFARLKRINVLQDRFDYPSKSEYNPHQLWRESLGIFLGEEYAVADVRLVLHPRWLTYARSHTWHPSQHVKKDADGRVVVTLRMKLCPELEAWVLSFGDQAEVVRPRELRESVAARLRAAAETYAANG